MAEDNATQPAADDKPDSRRVKIQREGSEPATCIPYEDGSGQMQLWYPEAGKAEFEVKAIIAVAAIASGFFIEAPDSKTKTKKS
jgi:hypothetical protein